MINEKIQLPDRLYHYTDQNGFLGIVNNNALWATKILYLNDNLEFKLAIEIANEILNKKRKNSRNENEDNVIGAILMQMLMAGQDSVYVTSFSENGDLLSQWRGYSKGMAGYSMGFNFLALHRLATSKDFTLKQCIYDESQHIKIIDNAIDVILNKYNFIFEHLDMSITDTRIISGRDLKTVTDDINDKLLQIFPLIKHESFREEMEWRLISKKPEKLDDFCFRPGNSTLIPYIELQDNALISGCMVEAIVGHTPNSELAIASTREFLRSKNIDIPVKATVIPFRSW